MDGDACELRPHDFALASVKTSTNVEAHQLHLVADRLRGTNGASRAVEGCEEPVTCGVDLLPVERRKFTPDQCVMAVEQFAPLPVAQCGRPLRCAHHVGEQHGREHAIELQRVP